MKPPIGSFDEREANALGHQIVEDLKGLPAASEEILAAFGDRQIWSEMQAVGLIRTRQQYDRLVEHIGPTLTDLYTSTTPDKLPGWLYLKLQRVPGIGHKQITEIGNFIRVTYGFDPEYLPGDDGWSFEEVDEELDVEVLDDRLMGLLATPLDLQNLGVSKNDLGILTEHDVTTVGGFVVRSENHLIGDLGLSQAGARRIDQHIEELTGISKSELRKNSVVREAVKWKYAALRARTPE